MKGKILYWIQKKIEETSAPVVEEDTDSDVDIIDDGDSDVDFVDDTDSKQDDNLSNDFRNKVIRTDGDKLKDIVIRASNEHEEIRLILSKYLEE